MKILFFTELYHIGGVHNVIMNLITKWPKEDRLVLLCNENLPGLLEIQNKLQDICQVVTYKAGIEKKSAQPQRLVTRKFKNALTMFKQYLLLGYYALYFKKLTDQYSPDRVIIVNGGYPGGYTCRAMALGSLFASREKKPIMNYHNLPVKPHWLLAIPEFIIDWLLEKSVSCFLTVSNSTDKELANRPALSYTPKRCVIYNGTEVNIDYDNQIPHDIRSELELSKDVPIILMLATYEERKGHDFLLNALLKVRKEISDVCLIVAGYGFSEERRKVEKLVEHYKLSQNVHLLGFRKDAPLLIGQAQIVVMPSQRNESFGLTILEAMAQRIPVVATAVGGMPEILENGKGGYIVQLDTDLFADKLITLLKDPDLRKRLGDAGHEILRKKFTTKRMVNEYYQLTRQIGIRY